MDSERLAESQDREPSQEPILSDWPTLAEIRADFERAMHDLEVEWERLAHQRILACIPGQVECGLDHAQLGKTACDGCGAQV